jgi:hypothetical protein
MCDMPRGSPAGMAGFDAMAPAWVSMRDFRKILVNLESAAAIQVWSIVPEQRMPIELQPMRVHIPMHDNDGACSP